MAMHEHKKVEASLIHALTQVRGGNPLRSYHGIGWWMRSLWKGISLLFSLGIMAWLLFRLTHQPRLAWLFTDPGWQRIFVGLWGTAEAWLWYRSAFVSVFASAESIALQHLPIRGHEIVRWVLKGSVGPRALGVFQRALLLGSIVALPEFSVLELETTYALLLHACVFTLMVAAAAHALPLLPLAGSVVQVVSHGVWILAIGVPIAGHLTTSDASRQRFLSLLEIADYLSCWMPGWPVGSRIVSLLALVLGGGWLLGGLIGWYALPALWGGSFEAMPTLEIEPAVHGNKDDDACHDSDQVEATCEEASAHTAQLVAQLRTDSSAGCLASSDWVGRWTNAWLSSRQRVLCSELGDTENWTRRLRVTCATSVVLALITLLMALVVTDGTSDSFRPLIWLGLTVMVCTYAAPFRNQWMWAAKLFPVGQSVCPAYCMMPITARELTELSLRLRWARALVMAPVVALGVGLIVVAQEWGAGWERESFGHVVFAGIGGGFCVLAIAALGPLIVVYRLQTFTRGNWHSWLHRLPLIILIVLSCCASSILLFVVGIFAASVPSLETSVTLMLPLTKMIGILGGGLVLIHAFAWVAQQLMLRMLSGMGLDLLKPYRAGKGII